MESDVIHRLHEALPGASEGERRVAVTLIEDPMRAVALTIVELAQLSGTSPATVARFCRNLGFSGFRQMRVEVAAATSREHADLSRLDLEDDEINPADTLEAVIAKIAYQEEQAIKQTAKNVNREAMAHVVSAITAASRIDIYGFASSAITGQDLQQKLHRIGLIAHNWSDIHLALQSAALMKAPSVAIGISHSGTTVETINALSVAQAAGATTVVITNYPDSPITRNADHVLTTRAREGRFRSGAMASRTAQLTLVDILFVRVAQATYDEMSESLRLTYDAVRSHHTE